MKTKAHLEIRWMNCRTTSSIPAFVVHLKTFEHSDYIPCC